MNGLIHSSLYFGMLVSVGAYMLGVWLKKKTGWAILNPLLVAIIVVIAFLSVFHIEYKEYNRGAVYLSYFLTPATVCLAIPLYKQLELLRQRKEFQEHLAKEERQFQALMNYRGGLDEAQEI